MYNARNLPSNNRFDYVSTASPMVHVSLATLRCSESFRNSSKAPAPSSCAQRNTSEYLDHYNTQLQICAPLSYSITMAQKARKDRARANEASLKALHIGSAAVNALFITWCFILPFTAKRSIAAYIILSIPAVVAQYILESTGRPRYVDGQMKNSGEDLAAPGLTEYLFDIVWITWTSLISVIFFGNWGWLLFVSRLLESILGTPPLMTTIRLRYRCLDSTRDGDYWVWHEGWLEEQMEPAWNNSSQWPETESSEEWRHNFT